MVGATPHRMEARLPQQVEDPRAGGLIRRAKDPVDLAIRPRDKPSTEIDILRTNSLLMIDDGSNEWSEIRPRARRNFVFSAAYQSSRRSIRMVGHATVRPPSTQMAPDLSSSPTRKQLLLARLAFVRRELNEVLQHLTDDRLDYAPGPGVRPTYDQFLEIGMNEVMAIALLRDGKTLTHAEAEAGLSHEPTVAAYEKMLGDVRSETLAYIETLSEEDLAEPVEASNPWYASFGLKLVPRYDALTSIALHESYHVAQLVTYAWARGDDPYQW